MQSDGVVTKSGVLRMQGMSDIVDQGRDAQKRILQAKRDGDFDVFAFASLP